MKAKINRFFSDKRPDIRVGSDIRFKAFHKKRLEREPFYSPQTSYKKS